MESRIQTDIVSHRCRRGGQCRGMILPIFGLILVRICSALCAEGCALLVPPWNGDGYRARRCTLDAREPITIWMPVPAVSLCQPPWHWPHLPIYLSKGEIHLAAPFSSPPTLLPFRRRPSVPRRCCIEEEKLAAPGKRELPLPHLLLPF